MEETFDTSNINFKWLDNIFEQLKNIQDMERLAKEGCNSLFEYMQVPYETKNLMLADIQYKNLKFLLLELDILVDNISPIIKEKTKDYKDKLKSIKEVIDKSELFLKAFKVNNETVNVKILPLFYTTLNYLNEIKSSVLIDIGFLLYIKDEEKKKW